MSLNNRIYLRDRLSPGYRNSSNRTPSDQARTLTIVTLPNSSGAEPPPRASTSETFQLYDISRQPDPEKRNRDPDGANIPGTGNFPIPPQAAVRFQRL